MEMLCDTCKCPGNTGCNYPPESWVDCSLDFDMVCGCCKSGINRMKYRPEEDGQDELSFG